MIDTDDDGWIEDVPLGDGTGSEPQWREDRMATLLEEHAGGTVFVGGCVANQGRFYAQFEAVVLLSAPADVMLERVACRETNHFGKTAAERAQIVNDIATVEPLLRLGPP